MKFYSFLLISIGVLWYSVSYAQTADALVHSIDSIVSGKNAKVGISILDMNGNQVVSKYAEDHFPMQSVFKMHIALAVLEKVDEGRFSLRQKMMIEKEDLLPGMYSPLRDKYPNGGLVTLAEMIEFTVAESDNVGCDYLIKLLGGPLAVEEYFERNNFQNVSIKINEQTMQGNWDRQLENWTTPNESTQVLLAYFKNNPKLLSDKSYAFFWKTMKHVKTGMMRIRGGVPKKAIVAHKTGTSGSNDAGLSLAVNDMGIVFLPNGNYFYICVFVTDSTESEEVNEKIIADISKVTWDYFKTQKRR